MIKGSKELVRDINSHIILETLITEGVISRADLFRKTTLSKATVSSIIAEMLELNLVLELGINSRKYGRSPMDLSFYRKAGYIMSIDLGTETITAVLTDFGGDIEQCRQFCTPEPDNLIQELVELIETLSAMVPDSPYGLIGIAVGIHGITSGNRILTAPHYDIRSLPLLEELELTFPTPFLLENSANLAALGESSFQYYHASLAHLSIHTGVGLGLVIDNQIQSGRNGYGGEIGHMVIEPDGKPCPCGNRGCLEQYLSEKILLEEFAGKKNLNTVSFRRFMEFWRDDDPDAKKTVEQFLNYAALAVNNIIHTYDPEIIVMDSAFTDQIHGLLERIKERVGPKEGLNYKLVPSYLKQNAIVKGGTSMIIKNFFNIRHFHIKEDPGIDPS